jgi:predicted ester cyclase
VTGTVAEQNAAVVRRLYEEGMNGGNDAVAGELFAPRCSDNGRPRTSEDITRALLAQRAAFPDWRLVIEDLLAVGDQVVVRWMGSGTHQGPYRGVAATGKAVTNRGITIWRLADGRLVERWSAADALGLLQQLGAVSVLDGGARP